MHASMFLIYLSISQDVLVFVKLRFHRWLMRNIVYCDVGVDTNNCLIIRDSVFTVGRDGDTYR